MPREQSSSKDRVLVQRTREFSAHHILLGTANMALESAEKKEPGWLYHELIAITFSALAIEAFANSFGERIIPLWKHFESSTPTAKLLVIAQKLGVEVSNFDKEPWTTACWLISFRNKIAHAKPELISFNAVMTREEFDRKKKHYPPSKIELEITLNNAKRAVNAVEQIVLTFGEKVSPEKFYGLFSDGWSGSVSRHND